MKTQLPFFNQWAALAIVSALNIALSPISTTLAAPPSTSRVSVSSTEVQGNGGSTGSVMSANGRFVVFNSDASNLVSEDSNGVTDTFVRDLKTGLTQRVSVNSKGIAGNDGSYLSPAISADGRFVAFASDADNLVPGDDNNWMDIFVRDLKLGVTQRVSVDSAGREANLESYWPAISSNGRFVAFVSYASNLVTGDNNGVADIFVRDLKIGTTRRVSLSSFGDESNQYSYGPSLSANGRFVAFASYANNLVENDNNGRTDVFVRDLKTGVTQRVSIDSQGVEGNGSSIGPAAMSANGRFVVFSSEAGNLVEEDNNDTFDVFLHDLKTGATQRVSLNSTGIEDNGSFGSLNPSISANGHFVAFESFASNFVEEDTNNSPDIFIRDLNKGVTQRVSVDSSGFESNGSSYQSSISADGRFVAFGSDASNLVPGDDNGASDVFVRRRW